MRVEWGAQVRRLDYIGLMGVENILCLEGEEGEEGGDMRWCALFARRPGEKSGIEWPEKVV